MMHKRLWLPRIVSSKIASNCADRNRRRIEHSINRRPIMVLRSDVNYPSVVTSGGGGGRECQGRSLTHSYSSRLRHAGDRESEWMKAGARGRSATTLQRIMKRYWNTGKVNGTDLTGRCLNVDHQTWNWLEKSTPHVLRQRKKLGWKTIFSQWTFPLVRRNVCFQKVIHQTPQYIEENRHFRNQPIGKVQLPHCWLNLIFYLRNIDSV